MCVYVMLVNITSFIARARHGHALISFLVGYNAMLGNYIYIVLYQVEKYIVTFVSTFVFLDAWQGQLQRTTYHRLL